jgi:excisionase family DNA binding protein
VTGFEHVCRRRGCGFVQSASDGELRCCPRDGRKLWPKAQVRPIRWHDLRHTTASLLKAAGVHLVDAQRILRHSDPRITQEVYAHVDLDQLRSAVNRMPVRIDNFPANVDGNVDGGGGKNGRREKRNNYGVFEEREKGFEPSTLALAIRCLADPLSAESVQERPNACNLEDLVNLKARPTVQDRPETSAESRPALHQTTTPGTLPFWLLKAGELSVLLTVREVADRLKVSRATVYGLVRRGELASVRVSNTIRVPRDAVEALVI